MLTARLRWLRIVVPVAFICGMLMSPHLWFDPGRSFPRAPIVPSLTLHQDFVISIAIVITLILSAITVHARRYLVASVLLTIVLVVLDQTRLQPWVYQYAIMLASLVFVLRGAVNQKAILAANQIVIASLYFWSGLQKVSWTFVNEGVPTLVESAGIRVSSKYLTTIAIAIAICEALIGVGLLLRRTRRVAVVLACLMHAIILVTLIASRLNTVVWPWNVAMLAITVILFWRNDETPFEYLLRGRRDYLPKAAMLICGLLPSLSFIGAWDLYLAGALYSGKSPVGVMRISETLRDRLPATARGITFRTGRGELMLPFYEWSLAELNVPPYPEVRVYRQLARQLCALDGDSQANALIVKGRPALSDGSYKVTLTTCSDLLSQ
jgi:hypothetical protein